MLYKNEECELYVDITPTLIDKIKEESLKFNPLETGGLLFGEYQDDCAIIRDIFTPNKMVHRTHGCEWEPSKETQKVIDAKWDKGQYIIGDWHSHPDNSPEPSEIDDDQLFKDANNKKLNCPEPILLIMGGNPDMGWNMSLHLYIKDKKYPLTHVY